MSLKHAILGFLSFYGMSGYDLKKAMDSSVQHFWHADQSQIYRTLRKLKKDGLVTQEVIEREERLDVKVYAVTEQGRAELHEWLTTPFPLPDDHDPFLIQVYFGGLTTPEEFLSVLRNQLRNAEEQVAVFAEINIMAQESFEKNPNKWLGFCPMLTLEHGACMARATVQWLQSAIERVEKNVYEPLEIAEILTMETKQIQN